MADILIIGNGPLPEPGTAKVGRASLRTWQICRPLTDSPHTVHLIALPAYERPEGHGASTGESKPIDCEGLACTLLPRADLDYALAAAQRALDRIKPSCIVAANSYPAYIASQLRARLPLWVDLSGCALAEGQIHAWRLGDERSLEEAWKQEQGALMRADKFSTASMPRLYALLGELGAIGRLNRLTAHYHFAHYTPPAAHPLFTRPPAAAHPPLRRAEIPGDACAALWSGSFDSWVDIDVLIAGLEKAMAANPKIHFVATGGAVVGHDELTYRRFRAAVEKSPHASRYHLLGWVNVDRLPAIYRECDLGLCVDGKHYETLFGSRLRLINMMAAGLPVAAALGTEISHILDEEQIGLTFPAGDAEALAQILIRAASQPHALRTLGQKGRNYVMRHFTAPALMKPLRDWVDEPRLAPDNAEKDRLMPPGAAFQEFALNAIQETQLRLAGVDLPALFQAKVDLDLIRSKWWRRLGHSAKSQILNFLRQRHWIP